MKQGSTKAKRKPLAVVVEPVVGLRWVDKFDGAEYEISRVSEETISYGHTPGQGVISGGAHSVKAWKDRVKLGLYIVKPNAEPRHRDGGAYSEVDCSHLSWCYTEGQAYSLESLGDDAWLTGCPFCGDSDCGRNPTPDQIRERDEFYGANDKADFCERSEAE